MRILSHFSLGKTFENLVCNSSVPCSFSSELYRSEKKKNNNNLSELNFHSCTKSNNTTYTSAEHITNLQNVPQHGFCWLPPRSQTDIQQSKMNIENSTESWRSAQLFCDLIYWINDEKLFLNFTLEFFADFLCWKKKYNFSEWVIEVFYSNVSVRCCHWWFHWLSSYRWLCGNLAKQNGKLQTLF